MRTWRLISLLAWTCACAGWAFAQDVPAARPPEPTPAPSPAGAGAPAQTIPLTLHKGTPLQVALDHEVRIQKAGQAIHGKIVQPVYAFDRIVVPEGAEVEGRITKIQDISGGRRTLSALNANFTPDHAIEVEFDTVVIGDGTRIPLHTVVSLASGRVMEFVKAKDSAEQDGAKGTVSREINAAKEQAKKTWDEAMKQVKEPGRMHRLERYLVAQLPAHPQYLEAGTRYSAELQEPLDFGSEPLTPSMAASIGSTPPAGSLVHARLLTPLTSATAVSGDTVEAVLWQPLFDGDKLILPEGSRLTGSVLQARPAHKPHQNGQLRFVFHQLAPPEGVAMKVNALPVGVEAAKSDHVELDAEGGAQATSPNTRYLSTGISIALAAASAGTDTDAHDVGAGDAAGNASNRIAGGAGGFKLVGIALGAFVHSQPLGMAMGAYGAGRSIYVNFVRRGQDLVFPKNTAMDIGVGIRPEHPPAAQQGSEGEPKP
ncbi:MAG TPA: hypothetical protein VJW51_01000 [Candidatus Acidoferrales bacterium]|nr:hypothetical protein [Candidatus Acidoferrales bacterium]